MDSATESLIERLNAAKQAGFDGYCTDCEQSTHLHNGRCGCGSGRVVTVESLARALQQGDGAVDGGGR